MQLKLTNAEKAQLRKHKIKIQSILDFAADEIEEILQVSPTRVKEIYALATFQQIPSVGIKFAEDLIFLGYYSIASLREQDGAKLTEAYERKKGYRIDSCVEDQFRLVVYFSKTNDNSKKWWDFTAERKAYRQAKGYPEDRPKLNWYEVLE